MMRLDRPGGNDTACSAWRLRPAAAADAPTGRGADPNRTDGVGRPGRRARRAGDHRSHRQLRSRTSRRTSRRKRRPRRRDAGRRRPVRPAGRGAGPDPGRGRRSAARRSAGRGDAGGSQREARRIAERAGADHRAALRGAAGDRRRLADGRRPGAHAGRNVVSRASTPRARRSPRRARNSRWPKRPSRTSSSPRRSPGFISAAEVSVGEYVQPSTPVVTLLKMDPLAAAS